VRTTEKPGVYEAAFGRDWYLIGQWYDAHYQPTDRRSYIPEDEGEAWGFHVFKRYEDARDLAVALSRSPFTPPIAGVYAVAYVEIDRVVAEGKGITGKPQPSPAYRAMRRKIISVYFLKEA